MLDAIEQAYVQTKDKDKVESVDEVSESRRSIRNDGEEQVRNSLRDNESADKVYADKASVPTQEELGEGLAEEVKDYVPQAVPWQGGALFDGQKEIVDGLKDFLQTGDFSALPSPDRVNPSGRFKTEMSEDAPRLSLRNADSFMQDVSERGLGGVLGKVSPESWHNVRTAVQKQLHSLFYSSIF